jgi:FkbM family methyltransferase
MTRAQVEMERPLPYGWQLAGRCFRGAPHFPDKWRLGSALMSRFLKGRGYVTTIPIDRGERMMVHLDDWIPFQIFLTGLYQTEELHTRFFRQLVGPGMVVFDIGANVGYYTLQAAVRVRPDGQVHAFEAVSSTYARLTRNLELNGLGNVLAHQRAVSDRRGRVEIFVGDASNTGTSRLSANPANPSGRSEEVEALTIDEYVEAQGVGAVDVIKIDVEGAELAVLGGMNEVLRRGRPRLLVEVTHAVAGELFAHLGELGYRPSRITRRGLEPVRPEEIKDKESLLHFQKQ